MKHGRAGVAYRHINTCEWCGQPFYCHRSDARFDSGKCRVAYCRFMKHARAPMWSQGGPLLKQMRFLVNGKELKE